MAFTQSSRFWVIIAVLMIIVSVSLLIALIAVLAAGETKDSGPATCGSHSENDNVIDISDPSKPGLFHDLTSGEIKRVREFLENDPEIQAMPVGENAEMAVNKTIIAMMDLQLPAKAEALAFLDDNRPQPVRQARVMLYRMDLQPPVVEERICGPLPAVTKCDRLVSSVRRNPVEISLRPLTIFDVFAIQAFILPQIDEELGDLLMESFGTKFVTCDVACFKYSVAPVGTALLGDINKRQIWIHAHYPAESHYLHPVDFAALMDLGGQNTMQLKVDKVWYAGVMYDSMTALALGYQSNSIPKVKMNMPNVYDRTLFSTINRRGDPYPQKPLRPPTLVEPDGKRFSLKHRQVDYMAWKFSFRMSTLAGPAVYDVRFKGERILYELALNELAVYYSGDMPTQKLLNTIDSGVLLGTFSKALVPGADCPETAVFLSTTVSGQLIQDPILYKNSFCLFEHNAGIPLRRHMAYDSFYGGMLDSYLTLRSILAIGNYDYIIDFMFHQDGVIDTRITSTGYIMTAPYREEARPYGFQIHQGILGNMHHHIFHFKVDVDISGTSNRYETLDITTEEVDLQTIPGRKFHQIKYTPNLKNTEKEALYSYNFDMPKYHLIHNNDSRTNLGEMKSYRLTVNGMSKQLLPEGIDNEKAIPWARHQMVVTKQKDDEQVSSSPYAWFDSLNPVTDFSKFYDDDEDIVDQDLVFWVAMGIHHIPRTEDLPVTGTSGTKLSFSLSPYNYFPECPSMGSRDAVRVEHKSNVDPSRGVTLRTYGYIKDVCKTPKSTFKDLLESDPDVALETKRQTLML